jgi:plastocyanin
MLLPIAAAALFAALPLLAACGDDDSTGAAPTSAAGAQQLKLGDLLVNDHGTKSLEGLDKLGISADSYYFNPTFFQGNAGQKVTLTVTNASSTKHNFSLPDQRIDVDIAAGGKADVVVSFPAKGVLAFFCKFHAGQGMAGELLTGDAKPAAAPAAVPSTAPTASGASTASGSGPSY